MSVAVEKKTSAKKRKQRSALVPILITLAGIAFIMYPVVATQWNNSVQNSLARQYIAQSEARKNTDGPAVNKELEAARHYNATRAQGPILDPWLSRISADNTDYQEYLKQLHSNGPMGRIILPNINVDMLVFHGTSETVLSSGVGHLYGTDLPVGGNSTHSVLTGHTGLSNATLFDNLIDIQKGNPIYLSVAGERLKYEVYDIQKVLPNETENLSKIDGKDLLTLITCTPYGINTHRLLVHAKRVEMDSAEAGKVFSATPQLHWQWWMLVSIAVSILLILIILSWITPRNLGGKKRKKQRGKHSQNSRKTTSMATSPRAATNPVTVSITIATIAITSLALISSGYIPATAASATEKTVANTHTLQEVNATGKKLTAAKHLTTAIPNVVTGDTEELDVTLIDPQATANLRVRKPHANPYDEVPAGKKPAEPKAGVHIRVTPVNNIVLNTDEGWAEATKLTIVKARKNTGDPIDAETDENGIAHFTNLPVGLYIIEEIPRTNKDYEIIETRPILLTVPAGGNQNTANKLPERRWAYDLDITLKPKGKPVPPTSVVPSPIDEKPDGKTKQPTPPHNNLALTGIDILGYTGAGVLLGGTGIWFLIAKRRKEEEEKEVR